MIPKRLLCSVKLWVYFRYERPNRHHHLRGISVPESRDVQGHDELRQRKLGSSLLPDASNWSVPVLAGLELGEWIARAPSGAADVIGNKGNCNV